LAFPDAINREVTMTTPFLRPALAALVCVTLSFIAPLAAPSLAAPVTLKATLSAGAEVPPNDSKGAGSVDVTYDDATKKLTWKGNVTGLPGPATMAHFHGPAEPGKNASVVIPISGAEKGAFEGSATLTEAQAADLLAGRWYVNVHTA